MKTIEVPVIELIKLEQSIQDLYDYLSNYLTEGEMFGLPTITSQIWKVANTKDWKKGNKL